MTTPTTQAADRFQYSALAIVSIPCVQLFVSRQHQRQDSLSLVARADMEDYPNPLTLPRRHQEQHLEIYPVAVQPIPGRDHCQGQQVMQAALLFKNAVDLRARQ